MNKLQKIIEDALAAFNETNPPMNLVLFEDALIHVARINRILESPRGIRVRAPRGKKRDFRTPEVRRKCEGSTREYEGVPGSTRKHEEVRGSTKKYGGSMKGVRGSMGSTEVSLFPPCRALNMKFMNSNFIRKCVVNRSWW
jgi:hypothetical protein